MAMFSEVGKQDRRAFLKGTAWMGLAAAAAGCQFERLGLGAGAPMAGFAAPRLKHIRIGFVGVGSRGSYALRRLADFPRLDLREHTLAKSEQERRLFAERIVHLSVLREQVGQPFAAGKHFLCGRVQVGADAGEHRHFAVLRQLDAQRRRYLAHRDRLRRSADTGNRQTGIHSGTDAVVEQLGLQINLTVRDGDHVSRDIGGDVAALCLDDRQRRQRAAALCMG